MPGITNAREAMKKLPEEDRAKIAQQVEVFRIEKRAFDNEVRNDTTLTSLTNINIASGEQVGRQG